MTFEEVGAPARLSGGPSPATNIPVVHTSPIQSSFCLEPEEPQKRYKKNERSFSSKNRPNQPSSSSVSAILPYAK